MYQWTITFKLLELRVNGWQDSPAIVSVSVMNGSPRLFRVPVSQD